MNATPCSAKFRSFQNPADIDPKAMPGGNPTNAPCAAPNSRRHQTTTPKQR
jgi:hypothetical protein